MYEPVSYTHLTPYALAVGTLSAAALLVAGL